jgi:catechol 2,3-dioxygenase-like lactoylglutathione lyase family enzyme
MSRLQLALNVTDLDAAVDHWTKILGVGPAKVRPGYANFAVVDPPLKLVLVEGEGDPATINHLGIEVSSVDEVRARHAAVVEQGLGVVVEGETTCCYAVQDKFWIDGGDVPFEVYTVLAPAEVMHPTDDACCTPAAATQVDLVGHRATAPCC